MQKEVLRRRSTWPSHETYPVTEHETGEGSNGDHIVNVQLVDPGALVAALAGPNAGGHGRTPWRRLRARITEEVSYRRSLRELRRLDDRDLDDLNLGRGDLPGLARRHAREVAGRA
jgi:uncharacterized protein YjiS (DUF1127 family)